jgi:hypothetical protein
MPHTSDSATPRIHAVSRIEKAPEPAPGIFEFIMVCPYFDFRLSGSWAVKSSKDPNVNNNYIGTEINYPSRAYSQFRRHAAAAAYSAKESFLGRYSRLEY